MEQIVVRCRELGFVHSSRFYGSVRFTPDFGQNNFDPLPLADSSQVMGTPSPGRLTEMFWGAKAAVKTMISTVATPAGMDMADGRHERSSEGAKSERRQEGGVLVAVSDASAGINPNDVELV